MYLNYHNRRSRDSRVKTIKSLQGMTQKEINTLIDEYNQVSNNFYLSRRATKSYYELNKR